MKWNQKPSKAPAGTINKETRSLPFFFLIYLPLKFKFRNVLNSITKTESSNRYTRDETVCNINVVDLFTRKSKMASGVFDT